MSYELVSREDDENNPQLRIFRVKLPKGQVAWMVAIDIEQALPVHILGGECPYPEKAEHCVVFWIAKAYIQTAKKLLGKCAGPVASIGSLL